MSWDDLSMREKAAMMRVAVKNKIFEIDKIKEAYDSLGKLVSNSEVINPNLYTPSVNLNVNPALDYVGNALESISGYEYEGNPLNKLGIDMSFDLGTTGSSMYPNGIRFVKKFAEGGLSEGGGSYVPEKIKLESRPYIPSVKNVTDFTGNPLDNPTDLYYYDGKPLYLSTLNNMFGEDNYRVLKYDNGDVFIEPKFVETEMTIPELLVGAKMPELVKQQLDELEEKQLLLYWESPALTQGGEFKLNQPATMNYISSLIEGMKTPAEIQAILNAHKEQAKEMIEWFPFVGDAIDGYGMAKDVYTDIKKGDYTGATATAATGLGLMLLPEWAEKGVKKGGKYFRNFINSHKTNVDAEAMKKLTDIHFSNIVNTLGGDNYYHFRHSKSFNSPIKSSSNSSNLRGDDVYISYGIPWWEKRNNNTFEYLEIPKLHVGDVPATTYMGTHRPETSVVLLGERALLSKYGSVSNMTKEEINLLPSKEWIDHINILNNNKLYNEKTPEFKNIYLGNLTTIPSDQMKDIFLNKLYNFYSKEYLPDGTPVVFKGINIGSKNNTIFDNNENILKIFKH